MSPELVRAARRSARRSALWFVLAVVFVVLSIPALFDLKALFAGLAVVCAGLGAVTAVYTWFDKQPD